MKYYVYALLNPKDNLPFYIGKGTGDRVLMHQKFKDGNNNPLKDSIVEDILREYNHLPYSILKEFENESDAYAFEEQTIKSIGLHNLCNICESAVPPSQKGAKRSEETIKKIRENSKKQGLSRTIEHVQNNTELFYEIITMINEGRRRQHIIDNTGATKDLVNKIKKNLQKYASIINEHTRFNISHIRSKNINGMKQTVFDDKRGLLLDMFSMMNDGYKRKDIISKLDIHPGFYDRYKNRKLEFFSFIEIQSNE